MRPVFLCPVCPGTRAPSGVLEVLCRSARRQRHRLRLARWPREAADVGRCLPASSGGNVVAGGDVLSSCRQVRRSGGVVHGGRDGGRRCVDGGRRTADSDRTGRGTERRTAEGNSRRRRERYCSAAGWPCAAADAGISGFRPVVEVRRAWRHHPRPWHALCGAAHFPTPDRRQRLERTRLQVGDDGPAVRDSSGPLCLPDTRAYRGGY